MTRYAVTFETTASSTIHVEAEDEFEAEDKAVDLIPTICAQCSGWGGYPGIDLADWQTDSVEALDDEDD